MSPVLEMEDRWPFECRKRQYSSRKLAATVAKKQAKRLSEPIEYYRCEQCHCWHTGHPQGWKKKNGRG